MIGGLGASTVGKGITIADRKSVHRLPLAQGHEIHIHKEPGHIYISRSGIQDVSVSGGITDGKPAGRNQNHPGWRRCIKQPIEFCRNGVADTPGCNRGRIARRNPIRRSHVCGALQDKIRGTRWKIEDVLIVGRRYPQARLAQDSSGRTKKTDQSKDATKSQAYVHAARE